MVANESLLHINAPDHSRCVTEPLSATWAHRERWPLNTRLARTTTNVPEILNIAVHNAKLIRAGSPTVIPTTVF